ncbi:hypothetical protein AAFF_G00079010 [Aldrovandia affinis]|uniref:Uncharacterized protein n=1 Tax=Aldrovandia affinis TaxID=143900 RepID=A0AAD7RXH5_9TELE|nr:hypothetical protein AAFF_G00079010 [Aldrovandia affinis]
MGGYSRVLSPLHLHPLLYLPDPSPAAQHPSRARARARGSLPAPILLSTGTVPAGLQQRERRPAAPSHHHRGDVRGLPPGAGGEGIRTRREWEKFPERD